MNRHQNMRSATRHALQLLHNAQARRNHGHEPLILGAQERDIAAAADMTLASGAPADELEQRMRECKNMLGAKQRQLLRDLSRESDESRANRLQAQVLELAHAAALCQCIASVAHIDREPQAA